MRKRERECDDTVYTVPVGHVEVIGGAEDASSWSDRSKVIRGQEELPQLTKVWCVDELRRVHATLFADRKPSPALRNTPHPWEPYVQDRRIERLLWLRFGASPCSGPVSGHLRRRGLGQTHKNKGDVQHDLPHSKKIALEIKLHFLVARKPLNRRTKFEVDEVIPSVCSQPTVAVTLLEILNQNPMYHRPNMKEKSGLG